MWRALFRKASDARPSRRAFFSVLAAGGFLGAREGQAAPTAEETKPDDLAQLWAAAAQQGEGVLSSRHALSQGQVPQGLGQVTVLGYHRSGDGGGGVYVRRSGTHSDPASVLSADGATWTLVAGEGSVSVRQFGAIGDGYADDTQSLQDACAYVQQSNITRTLTFPPGHYRVTAPLLSLGPKDKKLAFRGQDAETTQILLSADLDAPLIRIEGAADQGRVEWITFSELTFRNEGRAYRGDCVHIRQAYHVDWLRCRFIGWNGHALYLDDYWDSNFEGCRVIGCGAPNAEDAARAKTKHHQGKPAVWIGSSSRRVTSNNLNFNACQFESSWHNQMRLEDLVRRVNLNSCKFHGNQRADISESQLWIGGALAGKVVASVFAYGQRCDHIEFAHAGGKFRPRGWSIIGCDFSYSAGAAVRIRDGSHMTISANNFGQIGANQDSIVIEDTVPAGRKFRQIAISDNSFAARESMPRIARPIVVASEVLGRLEISPSAGSSEAQTVFMQPEAKRYVDSSVVAKGLTRRNVVMSKQRTVVKRTEENAEAGSLRFHVQNDGHLRLMLELDGAQSKVKARETLEVAGGQWDGAHLVLGTCHIWVDGAGALRMKQGAPKADDDGTVIGA